MSFIWICNQIAGIINKYHRIINFALNAIILKNKTNCFFSQFYILGKNFVNDVKNITKQKTAAKCQ